MFKIGWNGRRFYAVYAEYGQYRDVFQAMAEAERLNRIRFGPSESHAQRKPEASVAEKSVSERVQ